MSSTAPAGSRRGPRTRAMAVAIGVALVILVAFTAFVVRLAENAVRREARTRVRDSARLTARLVEEQSLRLEEAAGAYATQLRSVRRPVRARLSARDRAAVRATLRDLVTRIDGVRSAAFTDSLGRLVVGVPPLLAPGTDLSGRDWYRGVRARSPYLSRASVSPVPPHAAVTAEAVAIPGRGILVATSSRRTQDLLDALGRARGVRLTVTDQAGTVVGRTGRAARTLVSRAGDPLVAAALAGRATERERELDGRPTVSAAAPVPGSGWTVTADVPAARAFDGVARLRNALLAGAAVVGFLLCWLVPLLVLRLGRAREALGVSEAFQSDLLPTALPEGVRAHYTPSERRMLLGGDFLDAVRAPDGSLALLVGDVCGHGPRAAALGASLRAGWRTLATAGLALERFRLLDGLVETERRDPDLFATAACVVIDPAASRLRYALAGHPPPLLTAPGTVVALGDERGPAFGLVPGATWSIVERALPDEWALALYTDGLIEARTGGGRLGLDGFEAILRGACADGPLDADAVLARVARLADGGGLDDDLALLIASAVTTEPRGAAAGVGAALAGR